MALTLTRLLVGLLLGYARGYVVIPGQPSYGTDAFGIRWAASTNNSYDIGLSGGIAFAYSPNLQTFCSELTNKMKENGANFKWADCEQVENGVMRAMATWAANHQMIKFVDVSQACEREAVDDPRILEDMRYCSQAELIVSAGQPASGGSMVAALVTQYNDQYGAEGMNQRAPLGTAGRAATLDYTIQKTTMHFHTHFCWYLDNTFCGSLHATYEKGIEVDTMMAGICFGLWCIGFCVFLRQLMRVISGLANSKHKTRGDAAEAVVLQLSDCLAHNKLMLLLLVICPVVYLDVIEPCFSCYDFEAAVAHELGHVLGFGHIDQFFIDNMEKPEGLVMDSTTCTNVEMAHFPYDTAGEVVGVTSLTTDYSTECYSSDEAANAAIAAGMVLSCVHGFCCDKEAFDRVPLSSIMYSLTTHTARPCLAQDDLDGLNFLYPSCEYARQTSPICVKSERNIGYIRVALNVLIPFTIIALTSQLLFTYAYRQHTRKELRQKWKLMGRFVSVEDAAALCVQSHFRKHHAVLNRYKRDVMAIILQSAMRGAVARVKLAKNPDFANVALAVQRDVELQRGKHEMAKASTNIEQLENLHEGYRATENSLN